MKYLEMFQHFFGVKLWLKAHVTVSPETNIASQKTYVYLQENVPVPGF